MNKKEIKEIYERLNEIFGNRETRMKKLNKLDSGELKITVGPTYSFNSILYFPSTKRIVIHGFSNRTKSEIDEIKKEVIKLIEKRYGMEIYNELHFRISPFNENELIAYGRENQNWRILLRDNNGFDIFYADTRLIGNHMGDSNEAIEVANSLYENDKHMHIKLEKEKTELTKKLSDTKMFYDIEIKSIEDEIKKINLELGVENE